MKRGCVFVCVCNEGQGVNECPSDAPAPSSPIRSIFPARKHTGESRTAAASPCASVWQGVFCCCCLVSPSVSGGMRE